MDPLLVCAGSGLLTNGVASSAGVPPGTAADVFVLPYNDANAVETLFAEHGQAIAAVIVEPVAGNMGLVPGCQAFLEALRDQTAKHDALLVFDEVISGFRLGATTYSAMCQVMPDLTCLGKIIGGGMPIGAVAGPSRFMGHLAPHGSVYQAGTLSGNPVALAAGLATLRTLIEENPYARIGELAGQLADAVNDDIRRRGLSAHCAQIGSMFTIFFRETPVYDLADAKECDTAMHAAFFHHMLNAGLYLPPSQFEVAFVSAAHRAEDIEAFVRAAGTFPGLIARNTCP
jgi:glutamate-1-semialdehyde 2,1-aminomutase